MLVMKNVKRHMTKGIELANKEEIRTLGGKENFKFLGILKADTIKQVKMKEKVHKDYHRRTKNFPRQNSIAESLSKG